VDAVLHPQDERIVAVERGMHFGGIGRRIDRRELRALVVKHHRLEAGLQLVARGFRRARHGLGLRRGGHVQDHVVEILPRRDGRIHARERGRHAAGPLQPLEVPAQRRQVRGRGGIMMIV